MSGWSFKRGFNVQIFSAHINSGTNSIISLDCTVED